METTEEFWIEFLTKWSHDHRRAEILRRHLNRKLHTLPTERLHYLRTFSLRCRVRWGDWAMIVEMIEGLIALRQIMVEVDA